MAVNPSWRSKRYVPTIWIDGPNMYATCECLLGHTYGEMLVNDRMTFENRLWRALRDDWNVFASNLRLFYERGRVRIEFNNDEEFIMTKMMSNGT